MYFGIISIRAGGFLQKGYTITLMAMVLSVVSTVLFYQLPGLILKRTNMTLNTRDQIAAVELANRFAAYLEEGFIMGQNFKTDMFILPAMQLCQDSGKTLITLIDPNEDPDSSLFNKIRFCLKLDQGKTLEVQHPFNPSYLVKIDVTDHAKSFYIPKKPAASVDNKKFWPSFFFYLNGTSAWANLSPPQRPIHPLTLTPKLPLTATQLATGGFKPYRAQDKTLSEFYTSGVDLVCFSTATCVRFRFCSSAFHDCSSAGGWFTQTIIIPRPGVLSL